MANTITPKQQPLTARAAVAPEGKAPVPERAAAPSSAGWTAKGARGPSVAAQAIAPGSGKTEVMCPVLRALANEGRVQLRADGSVSLDALNKAITELGGSKPLGAATWAIGSIGNKPTDVLHNLIHHEFNVVKLPEGIVPHPADTLILRNGKFDEARFNELVSHADHGVMTTDSFARAIADNYRRDVNGSNALDATVRGLNFAQVEFAGLLSVFGSKDNVTGKTGITVSDLRVLYEQGKIPEGMQHQRSNIIEAAALNASLAMKADANVAAGAMRSVFTATGLSDAGARLANGDDTSSSAGQLASLSSGKAAACPHLNGSMKMPVAPADVVNAHTPAGVAD